MSNVVVNVRHFRTSVKARVRGKLYRDLAKIRERKLAAKVAEMRAHVHKLKLLHDAAQRLTTSSPEARRRMLSVLFQCLKLQPGGGASGNDDALPVAVIRGGSQAKVQFPFHDELPLQVDTITVEGTHEAPIVVLRGRLTGRHSQRMIDRLYKNVPGSYAFMENLLHRRVCYPCRCVLFFEVDGSLSHYGMETESLPQLMVALGGRLDLVPSVMRDCQ